MRCLMCDGTLASYGASQTLANNNQGGEFVKRRYFRCSKNEQHRFVIDERILPGSGFWVEKKDGHRELFHIEKVKNSIIHAATPSFSHTQSARLAEYIANKLKHTCKKDEAITSHQIGVEILKELKLRGLEAMWIRYFVAFRKKELGNEFSGVMQHILENY